jgi:hypothetical protein
MSKMLRVFLRDHNGLRGGGQGKGAIEVGGQLKVPPLPGLGSLLFISGGSARRYTTGYLMPPFQGFGSSRLYDG